jgi:hypothetical protein
MINKINSFLFEGESYSASNEANLLFAISSICMHISPVVEHRPAIATTFNLIAIATAASATPFLLASVTRFKDSVNAFKSLIGIVTEGVFVTATAARLLDFVYGIDPSFPTQFQSGLGLVLAGASALIKPQQIDSSEN